MRWACTILNTMPALGIPDGEMIGCPAGGVTGDSQPSMELCTKATRLRMPDRCASCAPNAADHVRLRRGPPCVFRCLPDQTPGPGTVRPHAQARGSFVTLH